MKLYCVYSQHFVPLYERFFEPSLRETCPEVEIISDVCEVKGNGDFRSAGFNQALIYKWKRGLEALYENPDQVILFTDVDILFHRPFLPVVMEVLGDADIAVSPESIGDLKEWGFNVGVLALRSTPGVRKLTSRILDRMILEGQWDQYTFNALLPQSNLKWKLLPYTFANGRTPLKNDSVLFHATCTEPKEGKSSLQLKMDALLEAERFFIRAEGASG